MNSNSFPWFTVFGFGRHYSLNISHFSLAIGLAAFVVRLSFLCFAVSVYFAAVCLWVCVWCCVLYFNGIYRTWTAAALFVARLRDWQENPSDAIVQKLQPHRSGRQSRFLPTFRVCCALFRAETEKRKGSKKEEKGAWPLWASAECFGASFVSPSNAPFPLFVYASLFKALPTRV